ncbi:MAG: hypothetical protein AAF990_18910 [Bacteroidota bacterium]
MMRELIGQMKWQFLILFRNQLIYISIGVTLIYALVFFLIKDLGHQEKILTMLVYNDPAVIGLLFVGISILLEKKNNVLSAIFVSPSNLHIYLWARVLCLTIIGWICALAMALFALGFSFSIFHFSIGIMGVCILCSLLGICVVGFSSNFILYLLKSVFFLLLLSTPLLNYFGATDIGLLYYTPIQPSLNLLSNAYLEEPNLGEIIYGYVGLVLWIPVFYWMAYRLFRSRVAHQII